MTVLQIFFVIFGIALWSVMGAILATLCSLGNEKDNWYDWIFALLSGPIIWYFYFITPIASLIRVHDLDHCGIVGGIMDQMGLVQQINQELRAKKFREMIDVLYRR